MAHQAFKCAGLVVDGQFIDDCLAGFIEADQFDLGPFTAEFEHDHIKGRNT